MTARSPGATGRLSLTLDGDVADIAAFYAEVNRVFMAGEGWRLGESLDAFDDMLRGGYGATRGFDAVDLHWRDIERSRHALGVAATRAWIAARIAAPGSDAARFRAQMAALDRGDGRTYFDRLMEIVAAHDRIRLIPG